MNCSKKCSYCNKVKLKTHFNKNRSKKDGHSSKCKECRKIYDKQYRQENRERKAKIKKKYTSKLETKTKRNKYRKQKRNLDLNFRLKEVLRARINSNLRKNNPSAIKFLGCSIRDLKKHLEEQFQEGMSWNNWGRNGWHIDHVIPLNSFDLTDKKNLMKVCHFSNLQPLWAKDNLSKGSKHELF